MLVPTITMAMPVARRRGSQALTAVMAGMKPPMPPPSDSRVHAAK